MGSKNKLAVATTGAEYLHAAGLSNQLFKRTRLGSNLLFSALTVSIALGGLPGTTQAASLQNTEEIYVFGDSLSDVGNVFKATGGAISPSPPYAQGRFSNGLVWVEYLAPKLGLSPNLNTNFAFGGATTGSTNLVPVLPGLQQQINSFTATNPSANPNGLYIVWAGANDYLGGTTSPSAPVENLSAAVRSLAAVGAQDILVPNLPDLGELPSTLNSTSASALNDLTRAHNINLAQSLDSLSYDLGPDTNIIPLDVNTLVNEVSAAPAEFGFTNVTDACLGNPECDNLDEFLFWDGIHPTTAAHRQLGEAAFAAVPEPSYVSGTLVAGALGAGFLLRRKRKKRKFVTLDRKKV
jgi:phospholipase/lecithinase/hemolysin